MAAERIERVVSLRRCPYLGLDWDRNLTALHASPDHRCYAGGGVLRISPLHQTQACLTGSYSECPSFVREMSGDQQPAAEDAAPRPLLAAGLIAGLFALGFALGLALGALRGA